MFYCANYIVGELVDFKIRMVANSSLLRSSTRRGPWSLSDSYNFIAHFLRQYSPGVRQTPNLIQRDPATCKVISQRHFHNYFLTNLPSSSTRLPHKISPSSALPQTSAAKNLCPAPVSSPRVSRELTVVRIPLQSARQHFGAFQSRGTRLSIEDTYQAGTIDIPAFAKSTPINVDSSDKNFDGIENSNTNHQVFCFGVFDGHGGNECSDFLREKLHDYVEKTAGLFGIESSLCQRKPEDDSLAQNRFDLGLKNFESSLDKENSEKLNLCDAKERKPMGDETYARNSILKESINNIKFNTIKEKVSWHEKSLIQEWKETVGGYFRRFKPEYFNLSSEEPISMESVLMYAFLKADLDFVSAQAHKPEVVENQECYINTDNQTKEPVELNFQKERIGGPARFFGGSTASIALISTPTVMPFWHPDSPSTIIVAHVGDSRIILCDTATGLAKPCTSNHHPSLPTESNRLRRYSTTFTTDSFGEERMSGLANTRSFGDMNSKRLGVSAEPEIRRIELVPAECSMLVLVSDGVSGILSDQEIVDVIKEAKTPEQGARDVVSLAIEVSKNGDNATCLVVRLGGWERRAQGGLGSLGTKKGRDWRRGDASDMRKGEYHR